MGRKKSKEELISEIQSCFDKHGFVNRRVYNEDDEFSSGKTVYNHFGSFKNGCEEAGVPHEDKPQQKDKVKVECLQCGRERRVYPHRAEKEFPDGTSETCGECMDKKQKVSCSWCGEKIIRHNYMVQQAENNFCDQECLGKWRSENIIGEKHPRYKGGTIHEMGKFWSSIREKVIQRDDEKCIECGMNRSEHVEKFNRDINVHHIVPRREFMKSDNKTVNDSNEMDNLETLCITCHMQKEAK